MDSKLEQFTGLWCGAQKVLKLYLTSVIYNRADAEDILQRVALCAYRKMDDYAPDQPFQGWVFGIAKFEVLSYFRNHGRRGEIIDSEVSERMAENLIDQSELLQQEDNERRERLERLLRQLPAKAQELIRLRFFENREYEDIAQIMNTNEGAVRTAVSRIIAKLRAIVAANREEDN